MTTTPDKKTQWLNAILNDVHALMGSDAYFRLWVKAQEAANTPHGPISQVIISNYVSFQLAGIRRLCDTRRDVIALPKLLNRIKRDQPYRATAIGHLLSRLDTECGELCRLATLYIAHSADPDMAKNWKAWKLTSAQLTTTHKAICEVAIIIERDLLQITQRTSLIRVFQGDYLAEVKSYVPEDQLPALREFWHAHNDMVNKWVYVARPV